MSLKKEFFIVIFMFILILSLGNLYAQGVTPDSAKTNSNVNQNQQQDTGAGQVIEAGEATIKVEVEKPQVHLFSQRIKPEFDEVNLEKSFVKEIVDKGQVIKIEPISKEEEEIVDIKKILNRSR